MDDWGLIRKSGVLENEVHRSRINLAERFKLTVCFVPITLEVNKKEFRPGNTRSEIVN